MRRNAKDSKVDLLSTIGLFRACSPKQLGQIAGEVDEVDFQPGAVLCAQGRPSRQCFIVAEGAAEVEIDGKHVARLGPGETVGELGLLDRRPRTATVRAATPMRTYVLDAGRFSSLVTNHPEVARALLVELSTRLRRADEALV